MTNLPNTSPFQTEGYARYMEALNGWGYRFEDGILVFTPSPFVRYSFQMGETPPCADSMMFSRYSPLSTAKGNATDSTILLDLPSLSFEKLPRTIRWTVGKAKSNLAINFDDHAYADHNALLNSLRVGKGLSTISLRDERLYAKHMGEMVSLVTARKGGRMVAGFVLTQKDGYATWRWMARDAEDREGATNLLTWETLTKLKGEGLKVFDMGGTGATKGIEFFKAKWGGRVVEYGMEHHPNPMRRLAWKLGKMRGWVV